MRSAPPSPESVEKLLALTKADKSGDLFVAQISDSVGKQLKHVLQGQEITPADEATIKAAGDKIAAAIKAQLGWDKVKPGYVQAYTDAFSQEEVDGLIAFYSSPIGQIYADKGPALAQKTQALVQQQLMPVIMPVVQGAMQEAVQ
jgi:hypothetical protein